MIGLSSLVNGKVVTSIVIAFDVQFPTEAIASQLSISESPPIYHLIRLRNVDDEPYVIEETYMPVALLPGLTDDVLHASIYNYIQKVLEFKIGGAHRRIRADKPSVLDVQYLDCKADDPILEVEQIGFLNNGTPFEYSFSRHRYDKFVFSTVAIRK